MSDTQAAMREFRFLDDKRKTNGLTPTEEQRWQELAATLGIDLSAQQQPAGYYGEDGQWYAYPEGYDPNAAAWGYGGYGYPQQPQGYYGPDGQWYPYPAPAPYDPNAAAYGYPPGYGYPPAGGYPPPGYDPAQWAAWQAQQQQQAYAPQGEWSAPTEGGPWAQPADPSGGWTANGPGEGLPAAPPPSAPAAPTLGLPSLPLPAASAPRAPSLGLPSLPQPAPSAPRPAAPPAAPWKAEPEPGPGAPWKTEPEPGRGAPWKTEPEPSSAAKGPTLSPFGPPIMGGSLRAKLAGAAAPAVPAPPKPEPVPVPPAPFRSAESAPELRTEDVMEISDEEVLDIPVTAPPAPKQPAAEPPRPIAAPTGEDPVADLRSALSMDDELDFSAELSPEPSPPAPAPVAARPAPPPPPAPPPVAPPVLDELASPPALGLEDDAAPTDVALPSAAGKPPPAAALEPATELLSLDVPLVDATSPVFSSSSGITQIEAAAATALAGEANEEPPAIPLLDLPPPTQAEAAALSGPAVEATLAAVAAEPMPQVEPEPLVDRATDLSIAGPEAALGAAEAAPTPAEAMPAVEASPGEALQRATIPELPSVSVDLPELQGEAVVEPLLEVSPERGEAIPTIEIPTVPEPAATTTPLEVPVETSWGEAATNPAAEVVQPAAPEGPAAAMAASPAIATEPEAPGASPVSPTIEVPVTPASDAPVTVMERPTVEVAVAPAWEAPAVEEATTTVEVAVEAAWEAPVSPTVEVAPEPAWEAPAAAASPAVEAAPGPAWSAPAASTPPSVEVAPEPAWEAPAASPAVEAAPEPAWDAPAEPGPAAAAHEPMSDVVLEPTMEALVDVPVVAAPEALPTIDELPVVDVTPEPAAPPSALAGLALEPETAPLPAQAAQERSALFGQSWREAPEPEPAARDTSAFGGSWTAEPEPELPVATEESPVVIASAAPTPAAPSPASAAGDVVFASNWDDVPEVGGAAPAPKGDVVFASNWDAEPAVPPAAASVPDEWSTAPAAPQDKVELASTSDFVSWEQAPVVGAEESLAAPAEDFVVESSSAAELANDFRPAAASSVSEEKLELADNADFLQHQQLTQTGEAWTSDGRSIDVEPMLDAEVELEGEIIQGTVVEDDVPAEPTDSWGAAVSQPSPAPQPPPMRVPPLATPAPPVPVVAAPPPRPAPAPAPAAPPLQVRVATPIAAPPHAEIHPPAKHPPLDSAVPPSGPVPMLRDPFDRTGAPLSGESSAVVVSGEHRIILHTLEGQVKRGAIRDADLCGATLMLVLPTGDTEPIARERIKALFFMLTPGSRAAPAEGAKVRVTFKDGRQVAGFSKDHQSAQAGFFVVPADNRTNTERIFIYRHGLQSVLPE